MNKHLCSYTLEELKAWFVKAGEKTFRANQIFEWIYQKQAMSFEEMTNLSKELREKLKKAFLFPTLKLKEKEISADQETIKFLFELADGKFIEAVLINSFERRTVCVSSQVGCKGACKFCASGKKGFFRNLSSAEIIEQILFIENYLKEKITNVVFMGMGEPLDNLENVVKTIKMINDPKGLNLSQRRISISTVGLIDKINMLLQKELKVNLVLSLHAPNQQLREELIPYAKKNKLEELLKVMAKYAEKTSRDITFEYILIEGINDSEKDALELADKLERFDHFSVNLIPYNPILGEAGEDIVNKFKRPASQRVNKFKDVLEKKKIPVTQRYAKGGDIAASCGQLALRTPTAHK